MARCWKAPGRVQESPALPYASLHFPCTTLPYSQPCEREETPLSPAFLPWINARTTLGNKGFAGGFSASPGLCSASQPLSCPVAHPHLPIHRQPERPLPCAALWLSLFKCSSSRWLGLLSEGCVALRHMWCSPEQGCVEIGSGTSEQRSIRRLPRRPCGAGVALSAHTRAAPRPRVSWELQIISASLQRARQAEGGC